MAIVSDVLFVPTHMVVSEAPSSILIETDSRKSLMNVFA